MKISDETLNLAAMHLMPVLTNLTYVPDLDEWNRISETTRNQMVDIVKVVAGVFGRECVQATDFVTVMLPLEAMRHCMENGVDMGFSPELISGINEATDLGREVAKQVCRDKFLSVS